MRKLTIAKSAARQPRGESTLFPGSAVKEAG
jgi:hypothetical protein